MYSQKWNCSASFTIPTFMCERFIYSQVQSAYLAAAKIGRPILGIYNSLTDTWNVEIGRQNRFCFGNNEAAQFLFSKYINRNLTFMLDSHWPFISAEGWQLDVEIHYLCAATGTRISSHHCFAHKPHLGLVHRCLEQSQVRWTRWERRGKLQRKEQLSPLMQQHIKNLGPECKTTGTNFIKGWYHKIFKFGSKSKLTLCKVATSQKWSLAQTKVAHESCM
jgi:hypothetical protein